MQESKEQQKIYNMLQKGVYLFVLIECSILFWMNGGYNFLSTLLETFSRIILFFPPLNAKISQVVLIFIVAIGTKARKEEEIHIGRKIVIPIIIGAGLMFGSLYFIPNTFLPNTYRPVPYINIWQIVYLVMSFSGALILMVGADNISKIMQGMFGKDKWNEEEESFDQNRELVSNDVSINIPYLFYYKKRKNKGWINVDPFRGTLVIGTPGSGKSFGIINPSIRQLIHKNFTLCIYDFKFPDLGEIAYYAYLKKKKSDPTYKHKFVVINLNDVEKSARVNPLKKEYLNTLTEAQEMAESMVLALQKGGGGGGGAEQFFTQSAINFLASCIWFLATYNDGKYSTLPHLLSLLNKSYEEIFDSLFSNEELNSLLSTFKSSYDNKAFDQLEGQIGTLKVFISRLATVESFWVFSEDNVNLNISKQDEPTILILASDPNTQDTNSALYSVVLNRLLKLINKKGNRPTGVIADELPTIYIHKIDNLIATARSNRVAVMLGLQELPQFKQFYKKEVADTITAIIGNVFSGSVRDKATLDWEEKMYGKSKQRSQSRSVSNSQTTFSTNERMDYLIPAGKIASLGTGEMVGIIARSQTSDDAEYNTSVIKGKIDLDMNEIKKESANYKKLPIYCNLGSPKEKKDKLMANFRRINKEVDYIIKDFEYNKTID